MNFKGIKPKLERFKRIFEDNWSDFVEQYPRFDTTHHHCEIAKMLTCGSEAGGFAIFQCLCCGRDEHKVHFSCKSKSCLQCGKRYARESMAKIAARLLPGVSYRQVVLTLPEQLRTPFFRHSDQSKLYSNFMGLAHACLKELIQGMFNSTEYKIAPIVFLHTHGRNGHYHPHLHVILGEGAFHPKLFTPKNAEWKTFKALPLGQLRLLWKKHLLGLVETEFTELNDVQKELSEGYPNGFYAHPGDNKKVPKGYNRLIKYLTKYLSSPPIGVSKILDYDGENVKYYYQSHRTKTIAYETVSVKVFIGRMVQHILPKGFHRVRYYGLHASSTFKKWYEVIARVAGDLVDAMVSYANRMTYREFFEEVAKRNPLQCRFCGKGMELVRLYHPDRGLFFDLLGQG